ncbi:MAG: xanthine dehydrogenase family protein molybdopterin-binding subunit, partial [Microbacteriaceae bacterium]
MTITEIGAPRTRKEDARLITGRSRYTDNMVLPGMLHIALLRSPFAHANITSLNVAEAKTSPGVVLVLTGKDVADEQGSIPCAWPVTPDQKAPSYLPIAIDRVAFAGEIVACVIARTSAQARDALDLIDIDYDELPAVLDLEEASTDQVLAQPALGTN